jgi:4,5-DOPA dioxygenase extradiol
VGVVPPIFVATPLEGRDRDASLAEWARALPRPCAILVVSSEWEEPVPTRGRTRPRVEAGAYPAPPAAELACDLHALLPAQRSERALDRGVVRVLSSMFPEADRPALQLSLVLGAPPRALYALGRRLGPLAERGVLLVGAGRITGNAAEADPASDAPPASWARDFDAWVGNQLADAELEPLFAWRAEGPEARRAQPSGAELAPLFVMAGAASLYDHAVGFPVRGFEHAVLSRRCVQFGR